IITTLHPTFNLKTIKTCTYQLWYMFYHTQIIGIKYIGSPIVLKHWEIFSWPLLLHKIVLPPTRMGTCPPICIPSYQIIAQSTSSRIGYTHGTMYKCLYFKIIWYVGSYLPNLIK